MTRARGSSLVEMMVACGLFAVFMMVSLGLFGNLTRMVGREQKPAESKMEGRAAALIVARRLRNSKAFIAPKLWQVLQTPTDTLLLRDGVFGKTIEFRIQDGVLKETHFPLDYDPKVSLNVTPLKVRRLTPAQSFEISSGGADYPTRLYVDITLSDGQSVRAITNFREAI